MGLWSINVLYLLVQCVLVMIMVEMSESVFSFPWPRSFWTDDGHLHTGKVYTVRFLLGKITLWILPVLLLHITYSQVTGWTFLMECIFAVLPSIAYVGLSLVN